MVATVVTRRTNLNVHSAPSGWTEIDQTSISTLTVKSTWRKVAGASEPSNYTFSSTGSVPRWAIAIARYSGVDTTTPVNVTASSSGVTDAPIAPSVTTTVADTLIIRSAGSYDTYLGNPGDHTSRWLLNPLYARNGGATVSQASAGASGTADFHLSASRAWVATTIAIAPAAAPSGEGGHWYRRQAPQIATAGVIG